MRGAMVYLSLAGRVLVGLVFLAAVVAKLRNRSQFSSFVAATRRLAPRSLTRRLPAAALAAGIAATEVSVVVLLAVPMTVLWGFTLAGLLSLVLATAIVTALRRGERGSCNCFGASQQPLSASQVVRNLLLGGGAGLGFAATVIGGGPVQPAGAAIALATGGVAAVLLIASDDIAALFRPLDTPDRRSP